MNEAARHQAILDMLKDEQFATVAELSDRLAASSATIRRDIAKLADKGMVRKVHGGIAGLNGRAAGMFRGKPYRENEVINVAQKQAIAGEAVKLCDDGDTIFIHAGSTCSIFARSLAGRSLRVYTNSIAVSDSIWRNSNCHLHLLGGDLHREQAVLHSPRAWSEEFYVAKCFLGTLGITSDGLFENDPLLAHVVEMIVRRSGEVVVLADSSKFSLRTRIHCLPIGRISTLVTDDGISDKDAQMMEAAGVQLIIARPQGRGFER